jgi:hypothetical protein
MRALTSIFASFLCVAVVNVGSVRERHDAVKLLIGDADDVVVLLGILNDKTLHKIGSYLNLCSEVPGGTR